MMLKQRFKSLGLKFSRDNRVYIVPTSFGLYFAALVFVMFLISLTYGNNTLMLITFLLLSQFILFMLWAHFNLKYIVLDTVIYRPAFAKSKVRVDLQINNDGPFDQNEISFGNLYTECFIQQNNNCNIQSHTQDYTELEIEFKQRGVTQVQHWEMTSTYPLGLFKTWKYYRLPHNFLVYPELKGISLYEYFSTSRGDESSNFDFDKHVQYELNPKSNQIDWKIFAKSEQLLVRQYVDDDFENLHFDFNPMGFDLEVYISQMAYWIFEAQRLNYPWSFSAENLTLPSGISQDKYLQVMEYLACYSN
jgi:uncharacterized protein (DUF58 family)